MTSSQKKYLGIFKKFDHGQIGSHFQGVLAIAKALPVRAGYRCDITGETTASTVHCYNAQEQIHYDGLIMLRRQIERHFHLFKPSVVFF